MYLLLHIDTLKVVLPPHETPITSALHRIWSLLTSKRQPHILSEPQVLLTSKKRPTHLSEPQVLLTSRKHPTHLIRAPGFTYFQETSHTFNLCLRFYLHPESITHI